MAKDLNKWLDEFVENGADANNITEWPEEAGGGTSYTAGNGIHINNNEISADIKVVEAENITTLSSELLDSLNVGDIVNVPGINSRAYSVFCRTEGEIQLETAENVASYLKPKDSDWFFEDLFVKGVEANPELEGDEPNLTGLEVGGQKYKVPTTITKTTDSFVVTYQDNTTETITFLTDVTLS